MAFGSAGRRRPLGMHFPGCAGWRGTCNITRLAQKCLPNGQKRNERILQVQENTAMVFLPTVARATWFFASPSGARRLRWPPSARRPGPLWFHGGSSTGTGLPESSAAWVRASSPGFADSPVCFDIVFFGTGPCRRSRNQHLLHSVSSFAIHKISVGRLDETRHRFVISGDCKQPYVSAHGGTLGVAQVANQLPTCPLGWPTAPPANLLFAAALA